MTKRKVEFVFDERSLVTQEEIDMLLFRVDDPDWDVSQRGDVWELLPRLIGLAQSCANATRPPAPAATGDWAVNAMKRIDSIPKPSRESWSVLSWEEYYKECARIIQACYPSPAQRDEMRAVSDEVVKMAVRWHKAMSESNTSLETNLECDFDLSDAVEKYLLAIEAVRGAGGEKG